MVALSRFIRRLTSALLASALALPGLHGQTGDDALQSPTAVQKTDSVPAPAVPLAQCLLGGAVRDCRIQLQPGQKKASISVYVQRSPGLLSSGPLTLTTSAGSMDPTLVAPDSNGVAHVVWSADSEPKDPVLIHIWTRTDTELQPTAIRLIPAPVVVPGKVVLKGGGRPYTVAWIQGKYVPVPIEFEVQQINGQNVTEQSCGNVWFHFKPRMSGKVSPDSAQARWRTVRDQGALRSRDDPACVAETRWQLAEAAGEQQMDVAVSGKGIAPRYERVVGYSRQAPRITVGYGYFGRRKAEITVSCTTPDVHPECPKEIADTAKAPEVTYDGYTEGGQPYFALEIPVFLGYRPGNAVTRFAYERVRAIIGMTFEQPEKNLMVGLAVLPLLSSSSEDSPFQLSVGYNRARPYIGMSLGTDKILDPILTALRITGT